jgi:hypothetical protein
VANTWDVGLAGAHHEPLLLCRLSLINPTEVMNHCAEAEVVQPGDRVAAVLVPDGDPAIG